MNKTYFVVTIDTEEDNQWVNAPDFTVNNISSLGKFQLLCDKYDVRPTYLVTYGVANNENAKKVLRGIHLEHECELGAHLHPWFNPPYKYPILRGSYPHTYPFECSQENLYDKLTLLTETISEITGYYPRTFRAGRYGLNDTVLKSIADLGYLVDTSITPYTDWSKHPGTYMQGPNFKNAPCYPYLIDPENLLCPANTSTLLEIPITIRQTDNPTEQLWLRPYPWNTVAELSNLCQHEIDNQAPILNLMFHSSELIIGGSPNTNNQRALDKVYEKIETVFSIIAQDKERVVPCTLSEYYKIYTS